MESLPSRLPDISTSIFAVMSRLAAEQGAINLSQGFPDFRIDEALISLVNRYMLEGQNQYAPMPGLLALRQVIADVILSTYRRHIDPENEVTVTAGATEGLYAAITAFVKPGDEVIVFDPSYDSYNPAIRLSGGIPVHINLEYPSFSIDWDLVSKKVSKRTRMIVINTPHNPTGTTFSTDDFRALEKLAIDHDLLVLSDEVYERLTYDNQVHHSVLSSGGLAERSIAIFSFGKTFHATGWKCGYAVACPSLTRELRKVHQFLVFSVNTPVQWALSEYMTDSARYTSLASFYQKKRDFFLNSLKGSSLRPLPCKGSYFQLLSYEAVSNRGDVEMAEELTRSRKIASIPVSVFYRDGTDNRLLRFCFAKKEDTLERACEILRKI